MRYGDVVQFDPIESVIQLRLADQADEAARLMRTYELSDEMADKLKAVIFSQLQFDEPADQKGMLVVGNYGTGKSHLMSVISLLAEDAQYLKVVRHPKVVESAKVIAGRFKVRRIEISSQMSLRDIVTHELEEYLSSIGVEFKFPAANTVVNNKESLEKMMEAFAERYPNHGLLLVVDEFLEFLRSRKGGDLIYDLSFLREIGEICKNTRFRFIAGVQEAIFDSAKFEFVADSLRRVKDRFTQLLLAQQDLKFVISERLLKKSVDQQQKIRDYLGKFSKFYTNMNERMDDYVRLFPVHPDYIEVFDRVRFSEKRGALQTLSQAMSALISKEVPTDRPGLVTFDAFWAEIRNNPVLRADPGIREVIDVSQTLEDRIKHGMKPAYKAMAERIIHALSVHRLTTNGDYHVAVGLMAAELRDGLCLYHLGIEDMGGDPADDLLTQVQTVLREILKTVNGQFISKAADTEQYFLDLKKNVDYDAQIDKKAATLDDEALDRAYYSAIRQLMECSDNTYVTGHHIWEHRLEWVEHKVDRSGYMFFGAPNERPTAQPDRDFYLYFIQPFDPPKYKKEDIADEVFLKLVGRDAALTGLIEKYAAALDLAGTASGNAKAIYQDKASACLKGMAKWLGEKQLAAYEVTYQGKAKSLQDWLKGVNLRERAHIDPNSTVAFRDVVNVVAGICLGKHFENQAPEYPKFSVLITRDNREQAIRSAMRALAIGQRTKDAVAVLDALDMLDGDKIVPSKSRYAQAILSRLTAKGAGQVLNRSELVSGVLGVEYFDDGKMRLEPDWVVLTIACLVFSGEVVLAITGDKIDSSKLNQFIDRSLDDLTGFKHLERPKELNVTVLRELFVLLKLPPGHAQLVSQGNETPVVELQSTVTTLVNDLLTTQTQLAGGLNLWGQNLLTEAEIKDSRTRLEGLKKFAEDLSPYNSVGKLKNLRITQEHIEAQKPNLASLDQIKGMLKLIGELGSLASYLAQAEMALPEANPWVTLARGVRSKVVSDLTTNRDYSQVQAIRQTLEKLKRDYVTAYIGLHTKARLGVAEDKNKAGLIKDPRLAALTRLATIDLMPSSQLTEFQDKLGGLRSCYQLSETQLNGYPICQDCQFKPINESLGFASAANQLTDLDQRLDTLLTAWTQTLLDNLDDPIIQANLELLKQAERKLINKFVAEKALPDPLSTDLITAVQEALSGLTKEVVKLADVQSALLSGGSPATPDELKARFDKFIEERARGKEKNKLRFVVEE
ncbi:MAG: DUF6079 family protein [Sulfuritalea sp.]|nr:DUF6079 family protein [Sulfuritalea sp.]